MLDAVRERHHAGRDGLAGRRVRRLALSYERGFSAGTPLTIGLEEELILIDPDDLLPADEIDWVLAEVGRDERFKAELRASQLELCTPVCLTAGDAGRELARARADVLERIEGRLRLTAVGTHPASTGASDVTPRDRYLRIAQECSWATRTRPAERHACPRRRRRSR